MLEPVQLIYKLKNLKEAHPRLKIIEKTMPGYVDSLLTVQNQTREFGEKHLSESLVQELDKKIEKDNDYFHWDIVHKALDYRFLSYTIPKPFGGLGLYTTHFAIFMEELSSFCPAIANIFGAHALGLSPIILSPDIRLYEKYMREVADYEIKGQPVLFALAITEPEAGSDVEDKNHLETARLVTYAKKVKDGYILNGRKVFISNGSEAKYIWVAAVLDKENPINTSVSFIIRNDAKGFSVGSIEKKMGQRACHAAELIFEDVFIPFEDRVADEGDGENLIPKVLGATRGPVAAIATGTARGAFERLLKYLNQTKINGKYLFEEQWVQVMLVDIMTKLQMARQLYIDATMCCDFLGIPKLLEHPSMKLLNLMPEFLMKLPLTRKIFMSQRMYKFVKNMAEKKVSKDDIALIVSYSSMAKFVASDLAMEVISKAMEVMGEDGIVAEYGIEKLYRDAKLTQIYEGTNQINRLYVFKNSLI